MTFDAFETSDGQPVEFITFQNGQSVWKVTNANRPQQLGAATFEPLAYSRSAPSLSKNSDDANIKIKTVGDFPVVQLYTNILTSNVTALTIERRHENDPDAGVQVYWKGTIASVVRANTKAEILARPLTQSGFEIPRFTYQSGCNYFLYDGSTCRLSRNDFLYDTTLTSINAGLNELTFNGLRARAVVIDAGFPGTLTSAELDNYYLNGYIESDAGELRRIAETDVGGDPDTVRIDFPFLDLAVSDGVTVYAGCARSADICDRKFDNIINFGGFNNVPPVNPMATELPAGATQAAEKKAFWGN